MLLRKERVNDLLDMIAGQARVYVPARSGNVAAKGDANKNGAAKTTRFELYQRGTEPAFDLVNTTMPPKDMLFPQTQKMYRYGVDAEGNAYVDVIHDADEVVIFGIRSCDARSIECMDDVFLTRGYDDEFYKTRRDKLATVAIACATVAETCFCDSMGLDPNAAPSADVQLSLGADGQAYVVTAQTDKGQALVASWQEYLEGGAGSADTTQVSCTLKVNNAGIKDKLEQMFEHPIWEQLSKKCLTCGTCTYVCPTCHCFDISQENKMKDGERFRCWDSCMFSEYTEMAGNHNPRPGKMPRVRQRFMHKLCFFEDRYGKSLCVGCGRCVEKCPVALDITLLIDEIQATDLAQDSKVTEGA
jgi:ferredoxin